MEPYLAENMYYKVVGVKGELNPDEIPNFHVYAKCTKVTPAASDDELPDLSAPYTVLPKATENKPAGKPFTYTPSPIDIALPEGDDYSETPTVGGSPSSGSGPTSGSGSASHSAPASYPSSYPNAGVFPYPTLPWEEQGYCVTKQTIEYVDQDGKFLYAEM